MPRLRTHIRHVRYLLDSSVGSAVAKADAARTARSR